MLVNPRTLIEPRIQELEASVQVGDAVVSMQRFEVLIDTYRAAKTDWSHTLSQATAVIAPLGEALVAPGLARLDVLEAIVRDATEPRFVTSPKLRATEWEDARWTVAAIRVAIVRALAKTNRPLPPELDRLWSVEPQRLFSAAPSDGGMQHDFVARFLSGLQLGGAVFGSLPDDRALAFVSTWRAFAPSKNLELNLKGLFRGRGKLLKAAPRTPSLAERVRAMAERTGMPCTMPVYLMETQKNDSLNRIGGKPTGLAKEARPLGMTPVLTIDLQTIPELAARVPDARLLCLFVDSPKGGFDAATVVRVSEAEAEAGVAGGKSFALTRVEVPPEVFHAFRDPGPLGELHTLLRSADGRALGLPFYSQQDVPKEAPDFVLEARASAVGLNLGDSGKLFVSLDDAFWESS